MEIITIENPLKRLNALERICLNQDFRLSYASTMLSADVLRPERSRRTALSESLVNKGFSVAPHENTYRNERIIKTENNQGCPNPNLAIK